MKELSIEEKARRYDEAIKKVNDYYEGKTKLYSDVNKTLVYLFPKLKESEDERIRKALIELVQGIYMGSTEEACKERDMFLAWLEKQGKHADFRNKIQIGDKVTRNKDGVLVNLSQLKRVAKPAEVQGEQKPVEPQQDMLSQEKYAKAVDECIYGEQKPAESKGMNIAEKDMTPFQKKVFCIIDTTIEEEQGLKQVCDELLRLAHDEIMQNTVWSEEDKTILDNLIYALANDRIGNNRDEYVDWLKSLKDRFTWRPSNEQMHFLSWVANIKLGDSVVEQEVSKHLNRLLEDLKKLREE